MAEQLLEDIELFTNGERQASPARRMPFLRELGRQTVRPPGEDRAIGAMCIAAYDLLQRDGPFQTAVNDLLTVRANETPSNQVGDFRATIQTELLSDSANFPLDPKYEQPDAWRQAMETLGERYVSAAFSSPEEERRSERLSYNLLFRRCQTNVPERALPVEYVAQTRRERFANGVRWLDIGCGIMEGQALLLAKERHGVPAVQVVDTPNEQAATSRVQELLERDSIFTESVGVDLTDAYDQNTYAWSRGSLRPSELKNEAFMQRFDALAAERLRSDQTTIPTSFFQGDALSDADMTELMAAQKGQKFHLVSALTTLHQTPHRQHELLQRGRELLTDDGLLVISDFAWVHPRAQVAQQLNFYRHWHRPFNYRTFIWDAAEPQAGLQEIIRSKNSRCDTFQILDKTFLESI